jgi:hypothetical protein
MEQERDINSPTEFKRLADTQQQTVIEWIYSNLDKIKGINKNQSSYGLKHLFEDDKGQGGFYTTNGQFKGALLECGFYTDDISNINWYFNISQKSITSIRKRLYR